MLQLKETVEFKCYSEEEAKTAIENFRNEAKEKGYTIGAMGYTYKEKKSKGEVIAECWILKVVKVYAGIWDDLGLGE